MYRGFLKDFCAAPDGRIAYIVLKDCWRFYLELKDDAPVTSEEKDWLALSASQEAYCKQTAGMGNYLMIEGEDIANIFFEKLRPMKISKGGRRALEKALKN